MQAGLLGCNTIKHLLIMQTPPLLGRGFSTVSIIFWLPVGIIIDVNFFLERYVFVNL